AQRLQAPALAEAALAVECRLARWLGGSVSRHAGFVVGIALGVGRRSARSERELAIRVSNEAAGDCAVLRIIRRDESQLRYAVEQPLGERQGDGGRPAIV